MDLAKQLLKEGKKVEVDNRDYIEEGFKYEGFWVICAIEKTQDDKGYSLAKQNKKTGGMFALHVYGQNLCFTNEGKILLREKDKGYIVCEMPEDYKYYEKAKELLKKSNLWGTYNGK